MKRRSVVLAGLAAAVAVAAVAATTAAASSQHPAASASAANRLIKCGKTRTIGFMAPITGPAASIGVQQNDWAKFYVADYNRAHKKTKIKLNVQDTMLGAPNGTAEALKGAQALGSNPNVLAVAGPAGSNEIIAVTKSLKDAGLGWITGSSTRTVLTTDGTRTGFMFRTVPPDAVQGTGVANFILSRLKSKRVYIIDDQEAYSTGLADTVQSVLRSHGVTVTRDGVSQQQSDFSSLIAKIPRDTQLVYLPWQLPPKGQAFGQQMRSAGKGGIALMGSDGLFDDAFAGVGTNVYDSSFPVDPKSKIVARFRRAHGGKGEFFGAPTYAAVQVAATAIDKACKKGSATRASVRAMIRRTNIAKKQSLIGVALRFNRNGDLATAHSFGIYKSNGNTFIPF